MKTVKNSVDLTWFKVFLSTEKHKILIHVHKKVCAIQYVIGVH
jgi:hypothetical protein